MQVLQQARAASIELSPEVYLNTRRRDYNSLLHEIADSKDLGYCLITSQTSFESHGEHSSFNSNASMKAEILRRFW